MQCGFEIRGIRAGRYLRKTQELCFSLSIRYEARLERACPDFRPTLHQSVFPITDLYCIIANPYNVYRIPVETLDETAFFPYL